MVGHTHEDIDQMFSCISTYLRRNSIHDLQGRVDRCMLIIFFVGFIHLASIVEKHCKLVYILIIRFTRAERGSAQL